MTIDDELRRLFRDERLDVPVPEGMEQAIFERVRRRRQRRRRPAWFAGGATVVVLVGGGVAFGTGLDVPLLGSEQADQAPSVISESSRSSATTPMDVPLPPAAGRPQLVPAPQELQRRNPQRLSPRPTQGAVLPQLQQLLCQGAEQPAPPTDLPDTPLRGEVPPPADPCASPPVDDTPMIDTAPTSSSSADPSTPTGEPSEPDDPPSSSTTSSSAPPTG